MNLKVKNLFRLFIAFVGTAALCMILLIASALIPQSAIKNNMETSAEYLNSKPVFFYMGDTIAGGKIDRYADSILLNIANAYDAEHPIESTMWSSYYFTPYQNENANLYDAVTQNLEPNKQYLRYWHGSNVFVRLLLLLFSIDKIYIFHAVVLGVEILWLMFELIRRKGYIPAIGLVLSLFSVGIWYVPFSLEYTWMFMLMFPASAIALYLSDHHKQEWYGIFFIIIGVLTNFLDFLTTETLPCFVPLLLILWQDGREISAQTFKDQFKAAIRYIICFFAGYAGMWILKWIMASAVLHINALDYVTEHISERLDGTHVGIEGLNQFQIVFSAIFRNLFALLPSGFGVTGIVISVVLLIMVAYHCFVYAKQSYNKGLIGVYIIIALLPYIRYLVLHNHSMIHYFFTYRAQFATLMAIALIVNESFDWRVRFGKRH